MLCEKFAPCSYMPPALILVRRKLFEQIRFTASLNVRSSKVLLAKVIKIMLNLLPYDESSPVFGLEC